MKRKAKKETEQPVEQQTLQENQPAAPAYTQNIPDDEIWTFQVEGLPAPKIGKNHHHDRWRKVLVVAVLLVAISLSMFFSVRTVHNDEYEFVQLDSGEYMLDKYANPGGVKEVTLDYVDGDRQKPVVSIREFAFNCDEQLLTIYIGKDVQEIDSKSFYSCWALQNIYVDDANPYYCDIDGVLYTKDMTEIILYPIDHDKYLREQTGYDSLLDDSGAPMEELWGTTERYDEQFLAEYNRAVRTYVLPSTVTTIGELAFGYANLTDIYAPEGLITIESMGVFRAMLENLYTYTSAEPVTDTTAAAIDTFDRLYLSLPEGLESIGSDAFSYNRQMTYVYIPESVKSIGHHAFWDTVYKEDGELRGVSAIYVAATEAAFEAVETGDQWRPKYDYMLFNKNVDTYYAAERLTELPNLS